MTKSHYLTVSALAERLGYSEKTVRRWINSHQLFAEKYGGQWRIPENSVDKFSTKCKEARNEN